MKLEPLSPEDVIIRAANSSTVQESIAWIAEGHRLCAEVSLPRLLAALAAEHPVTPKGRDAAEAAIRRVARLVTESDIDTTSVILDADCLVPLERYSAILELLAQNSPTGSLADLTARAVWKAIREDAFTVQVLCAIAGLSYGELATGSAERLPSDPAGPWSLAQATAAFKAISSIVDTGPSRTEGAEPMRPVEFVLGRAPAGWASVERMRRDGVRYEVLLAQRTVGGAWSAHRNRTSSQMASAVADVLCRELLRAGIAFRRSTLIGGDIRPSVVRTLAGSDGQVGLVVLDGGSRPAYAVVVAVANNGGTARKSAARLQTMLRKNELPFGLLLAGRGWSQRNETAALARAFAGRLYSDRLVPEMVADIRSTLAEHPSKEDSNRC